MGHVRHLEQRALLLVAAVLAVALVAMATVVRQPAAAPVDRVLVIVEAPRLALSPPLLEWYVLRGGVPDAVTPMAPTAMPRVVDAPIEQYRDGGAARVFRDRPSGFRPVAIVLHATGSGEPGSEFASLGALGRYFDRPAARASAHYGIDRAGRIARYVPDEAAAFHVATRGWNDISIGVELLNDNTGTQGYTDAQLSAATRLVRALGTTWGIPVQGVERHRDLQPADRRDPGGDFPWRAWLAGLAA